MTVQAETPRPNGPFLKSCQYRDDSVESPLYTTDEFRMYCYKILPCAKRFQHNWQTCPFAHPGEKARRRCVRSFSYSATPCPNKQQNEDCPLGDSCSNTHSVFEYWLHPQMYRTQLCNDAGNCKRNICFFAHSLKELRMPAVSPGQVAAATAAVPVTACESQLAVLANSSVLAGGDCLLQPVMSPSSSISEVGSNLGNSSSNTIYNISNLSWLSAYQPPHLAKTSLDLAVVTAANMTPSLQTFWEPRMPRKAAPMDSSLHIASLKQQLQLLQGKQQQQQQQHHQAAVNANITMLQAGPTCNTEHVHLLSQLAVQPTAITVAPSASMSPASHMTLIPPVYNMMPTGAVNLMQPSAATAVAAGNSYLAQGGQQLSAASSQQGDGVNVVQLQPSLLPQTAASGVWLMCPTPATAGDSYTCNAPGMTTAAQLQQQQQEQQVMRQLGINSRPLESLVGVNVIIGSSTAASGTGSSVFVTDLSRLVPGG